MIKQKILKMTKTENLTLIAKQLPLSYKRRNINGKLRIQKIPS